MLIKDIFLNLYDTYTKPIRSRYNLGITALVMILIFAIASQFEVCLSGSKLFFSATTLAVVQNFYFCVEKEENLDAGKSSLTWVNLCFILLGFFYFYLGSSVVFFIVINALFYVYLIKSWTQPEAKISILKNVAMVILALPAFGICSDWKKLGVTVLGVPLSFAVWVSQVHKYERFVLMNHYLFFNLIFTVPLFFALDELREDLVFTWVQIVYTVALILFGSIAFNYAIKFVLLNELRHVMLILNEFSLIYVAFLSGSWIAFAAFVALGLATLKVVDFGFSNECSDPLVEQLNQIEMKSVEFKVDNGRVETLPATNVEMKS